MHIEILTEDKSGATVVERLVTRMCQEALVDADIAVRPHRGCGSLPQDPLARPPKFASSLLDLLPAKCRAYNEVFRGTDSILIVIMDSDDNDPDKLRRELYSTCRRFAPDLRSVIGLCTEEIEAWLLGDARALLKAYPDAETDYLEEYVQDSICGTWEALCKVICPDNYEDIIEIGYPAIGHYKAKWAQMISEFMEPENNISPSFINFKMAFKTAIKKPEPIAAVPVHRRTF